MSEITVEVQSTVEAVPDAYHQDVEYFLQGRAFGWGSVPETLSEDACPVHALVLMTDPAPEGLLLGVRPVALLHLDIEGVAREEVLCVRAGDSTRPLGDLAHPADNELFCEAVRRLHPHSWCVVRGAEDASCAEQVLDHARADYLRMTGAME
jgi:inorganic pyrophosphatase